MSRRGRVRDFVEVVGISARLLAGRFWWLVPLWTVLWPAFEAFRIAIGWRPVGYGPAAAQTVLIGTPMIVLAILLGVRIIAGEIDRRTLEITYTVPGGAHRVWIAKLAAALMILLASEAVLAVVAWGFFTKYPWGALYGALQGAVFYLVLAMTLAAWFKSEATAALLCVGVLTLNGFITGFGGNPVRFSPVWNPYVLLERGTDAATVTAWTIQNRVGFLLAIVALVALAFARAQRREALLSG